MMFWLFAVMAVAPGFGILLAKDIVRQAFWLLLSLVGFAGLYLHLGADFLGFIQVLVYIGGILILFLFGVMLTYRMDVPLKEVKGWGLVFPGIIAGILTASALLYVASRTPWNAAAKATAPTVSAVGSRVMSTFILPFEVISMVLLVALIGATYIARRKEDKGRSEE
ncbi:MAG: NADH-quinone oxidoreductase subunit J [Planctomycetes bacterium]|nr:NADH-quinone oxidoreductase subunit J [Planctomycetota bacterium]